MFTVYNTFRAAVPALPAIQTFIALLGGWAARALRYDCRRVRPTAGPRSVNFGSGQPYD